MFGFIIFYFSPTNIKLYSILININLLHHYVIDNNIDYIRVIQMAQYQAYTSIYDIYSPELPA